MSVAPPGAYGTMIFTVRLGYWSVLCAAAGSTENASAAKTTVPTRKRAARGSRLTWILRAAANWIMLPPRWHVPDRQLAIVYAAHGRYHLETAQRPEQPYDPPE